MLVPLPTSSIKLLAQMTRAVRDLNYIVDMYDQRKRKQLFHVNMLCEWYALSSTALYSTEV